MPAFTVYYKKEPTFFSDENLTVDNLKETHVYLKVVEAETLDDAWLNMQGEVWSPNGEARALIREKGLHHTSMSVGDVFQDEDGQYWEVDSIGFRKLGGVKNETVS